MPACVRTVTWMDWPERCAEPACWDAIEKIDELGAFHDPKMALSGALDAQVLPTTILYDAQGQEVWRMTGMADWADDRTKRLLTEAEAD